MQWWVVDLETLTDGVNLLIFRLAQVRVKVVLLHLLIILFDVVVAGLECLVLLLERVHCEGIQEVEEFLIELLLLLNLSEVVITNLQLHAWQHLDDELLDAADHFLVLTILALPCQINDVLVKVSLALLSVELQEHVRTLDDLRVCIVTEDDLKDVVLFEPLQHDLWREVVRLRHSTDLKLVIKENVVPLVVELLLISLLHLVDVLGDPNAINHVADVLQATNPLLKILALQVAKANLQIRQLNQLRFLIHRHAQRQESFQVVEHRVDRFLL